MVTIQPVQKGQELTRSYVDGLRTSAQRNHELYLCPWGEFTCVCAACDKETEFGRGSDGRRMEMKKCKEMIEKSREASKGRMVTRDDIPQLARKMIDLMKEEGLYGLDMEWPFDQAIEWYKGKGRRVEAQPWAEKKWLVVGPIRIDDEMPRQM